MKGFTKHERDLSAHGKASGRPRSVPKANSVYVSNAHLENENEILFAIRWEKKKQGTRSKSNPPPQTEQGFCTENHEPGVRD